MKAHVFCYKVLFLLIPALQSCGIFDSGEGKIECNTARRVISSTPVERPQYHPGGQFISFNYTPLHKIEYPYQENCDGVYFFRVDSTGLWFADRDGNNLEIAIKNFSTLNTSDWSPDGEWLAIADRAGIYKLKWTGTDFDSTSLVQLTQKSASFYPEWSPDGQWIAHNDGGRNVEIISKSGVSHVIYPFNSEPSWHPDGQRLITKYVNSSSIFLIHYPFQSKTADTLRAIDGGTNIVPKYSPDGSKVAFLSKPDDGFFNIWVMDAEGKIKRQLTDEGTLVSFDWSPDGSKILYVSYKPTNWSYNNGTIWEIDIRTRAKKQITFNRQIIE